MMYHDEIRWKPTLGRGRGAKSPRRQQEQSRQIQNKPEKSLIEPISSLLLPTVPFVHNSGLGPNLEKNTRSNDARYYNGTTREGACL